MTRVEKFTCACPTFLQYCETMPHLTHTCTQVRNFFGYLFLNVFIISFPKMIFKRSLNSLRNWHIPSIASSFTNQTLVLFRVADRGTNDLELTRWGDCGNSGWFRSLIVAFCRHIFLLRFYIWIWLFKFAETFLNRLILALLSIIQRYFERRKMILRIFVKVMKPLIWYS